MSFPVLIFFHQIIESSTDQNIVKGRYCDTHLNSCLTGKDWEKKVVVFQQKKVRRICWGIRLQWVHQHNPELNERKTAQVTAVWLHFLLAVTRKCWERSMIFFPVQLLTRVTKFVFELEKGFFDRLLFICLQHSEAFRRLITTNNGRTHYDCVFMWLHTQLLHTHTTFAHTHTHTGSWYLEDIFSVRLACVDEHVCIFPECNLDPSERCRFKTGLTTPASSPFSNSEDLM